MHMNIIILLSNSLLSHFTFYVSRNVDFNFMQVIKQPNLDLPGFQKCPVKGFHCSVFTRPNVEFVVK